MNKSQESVCQLFKTGQDATALFEPAKEPLDDVALFVNARVEFRFGAFLPSFLPFWQLFGGDLGLDLPARQVPPVVAAAVGLVRDQGFGTVAIAAPGRDETSVEQFFQKNAVVPLAAAEQKADGVALPVTGDVEFRRQTALRPADGLVLGCPVGFFWAPLAAFEALTTVESTSQRSQSISPLSLSCMFKTPSI